MRRFVVMACALGLLLALPVSAGAAKVIEVPAEAVFRSGNTGDANCQAYLLVQWPEQENAQAWRLEREYLKGTGNHHTHTEVSLFQPFDDELLAHRGWEPPAGTHWHHHTTRAKSAPGSTAECASLEAEMLARIISATVHVTVPGDPDEDDSDDEDSDDGDSDDDRPDPPGEDEVDDPPPPPKAGAPKCRGQAVTIFAQPGTPTNGTAGRDVILGTPGRDVIRARGGNDLICALPGNDTILGGGGNDVVLGQGGADTLHGQAGRDTLLGGAGDDRLFGGAAADRLFGQAGSDLLNGGVGRPDLCNGGPGRDRPQSPGCERRRLIP